MESSELTKKLSAYGADVNGITDRFMGDAELYEQCFLSFLDEQHFGVLDQAIYTGRYAEAFDAAHALKGLSGNLGLTPFFDTLCTLVESLRAHSYENVQAEYEAVVAQHRRLESLLTSSVDEVAAEAAAAAAPPESEAPGSKKQKKEQKWVLPTIAAALILLMCGLVMAFISFIGSYEDKTNAESAAHLIELSFQIRRNTEEKINTDWNIARSLASALATLPSDFGEDELSAFLVGAAELWRTSDVTVYTEDGFNMSAGGGAPVENDEASEAAYRAIADGEYSAIMQSTITYTVPVNTDLSLNGSRIVAVSIAQDLETFLDSMDFSSFDGAAWLYLTQDNGVVISRLTHKDVSSAFNIMSIIESRELSPLSHNDADAPNDVLTSKTPLAHIMSDAAGERYLISMPITTHRIGMRLFYVAPKDVVNASMDSFSSYVLRLSVMVMGTFGALAFVMFAYIYRTRKQKYNKDILARERMFDLMARNTNSAFALLSLDKDTPLFVSDNGTQITGTQPVVLERTESVFRLRCVDDSEPDCLKQLNGELAVWDGTGEFRSGYIPRGGEAEPGWFSVLLYPAPDGENEYVILAQDTTQQYEREDAVRAALAMAERANAAKSRFLSNMSHDIRTPMNAIVNMTEFAIDSMDDPMAQAEHLKTIRESADHLLKIINDVLDVSRIESGQTVIESVPFVLRDELSNLADIVRPLSASRRQRLISDFSGIEPVDVMGDRTKISQVLMNLLSNAVKFTQDGGVIRFTARELPSLKQNLMCVRFTVEDNGMGISEEELPHIFEPFSRADDERVSSIEGTGLGLSICSSYVKAMGGVIRCESELGSGSTFTVELFFQRAKAKAERMKKLAAITGGGVPFEGRRCLLCEDNSINQVIASTILKKVGFFVEIAENGREGLREFSGSAPGYYDVIYMDIQMPVMDGYQAAVAIRECGHPQSRTIPIIAMTANVFAEDIEKARIAGMNEHLGKPVVIAELIEATTKVLKKRRKGK